MLKCDGCLDRLEKGLAPRLRRILHAAGDRIRTDRRSSQEVRIDGRGAASSRHADEARSRRPRAEKRPSRRRRFGHGVPSLTAQASGPAYGRTPTAASDSPPLRRVSFLTPGKEGNRLLSVRGGLQTVHEVTASRRTRPGEHREIYRGDAQVTGILPGRTERIEEILFALEPAGSLRDVLRVKDFHSLRIRGDKRPTRYAMSVSGT